MNKEEINKLLEELKYNIPQDYVRSCDTTDGIGYYEDDEYSWQYQLHRYITNLQNQVEKLTQENQQLKNNWNELKEYLEKILEESCVPIRQYYAEHFLTIMQEIESRK